MATYEYVCSGCGPYDVALPMGGATPYRDCPECGGPARRIFSAPSLSRVGRALAEALDREERSRDAPEVVRDVH
ncbi:hypothetical protein N5079_28800 [Planotetraspora sp. A-T 1434]|uniref:FmdB family zinc ribbon protein n=1 Tax=Planotetraspora sp. A-T 1434 TaxID=2979219 RepID=UPI0021C1CDFA|nr:FmdB family zinc ribbon protein [Planotetraspora sp. A-T 1434]MCT9934207.1 hypothetical protein [Planotetraspora sp. A-T 1434]